MGKRQKASEGVSEIVSAQVILRPADPEVARRAGPVTAATIATHLPPAGAVQHAQTWFREHGFEVGPLVGTNFSIAGPADRFEALFKTRLRRSTKKGLTVGDSASYDLPLSVLPSSVRERLSAVTFTQPPDFGPTSFA